jgi:diacylglycerol O-acyltransferase
LPYERLPRAGQFFLPRGRRPNDRHGCFIGILSPGPDGAALDGAALAAQIAARLPKVSRRFLRVLADTPFGLAGPLLVDAPDFDVAAHFQVAGAPEAVTGWAEFEALRGRFVREPLDPGRPLWQILLVPRLPDGRSALLFKLHHAIVDGEAAAASISALLFNREPGGAPPAPPPRWQAQAGPGAWRRAGLALAFQGRRAGGIAGRLGRHLLAWRQPSVPLQGLRAIRQAYDAQLRAPRPPSPLNAPVGPRHAIAVAISDVATVQRGRERLGGEPVPFDDVILAALAGGLRGWFLARGQTPMDQVVEMPMSLARRGLGAPTIFAEMPSFITVTLPVGVADPAERLRRIVAEKERHAAQAAGLQAMIAPLTHLPMPLYRRWAGAIYNRPAHFHLASLRGPAIPLFVLGHRLDHAYVATPVRGDLGLRVAAFALCGKVTVTLSVDPDIVPEADSLARGIEAALAELAGPGQPEASAAG